MKRAAFFRTEYLCLIVILAIMALFFHLSLITHWADSELWAISVSRIFSLDTPDWGSHYKIAFHSFLKWLYFFPLNNLETINGARLEFAFLGAAIAILLVFLEREFREKRTLPGIAALLFCSSSFFLSQGYRVRSDLLACFFQISALWLSIRFLREPGRQAGLFILSVGTLNLLMFLATPKAVYHFIVNAVVTVVLASRSPARRAHLALFFCVLFGPLFLAALLILANWDTYQTAANFFLRSFEGGHGHPPYLSRAAFIYVFQFVSQNPLLFLLWVAATVSSFINWRNEMSYSRALALGSVISVGLIVLHNDRLPFFVFSLLPIPILHVALLLDEKLQYIRSTWRFVAIAAIFAKALYWYTWQQAHDSNKLQRQAAQTIETYLERYPNAIYYDEAAVLPRTNQIFFKVEPSHEGNSYFLLQMFEHRRPDLIFFSNGLFHYFDEVMAHLEENYYIQIGRGVYARAKFLPLQSVKDADLSDLCGANDTTPYYLYAGPNFMEMARIRDIDEIEGHPSNTLIACSPFGPIYFPEGRSFAQIFDFGVTN